MERMKKESVVLFLVLCWIAASCGPKPSPESWTSFEENGVWGFRDGRGKIVIEPKFEAAYDFHGPLAAVALAEGWRFIDRGGRVMDIRPFMIDNGPDYYSEGLARFVKDGRIGFLDEAGRIVIPAQFDFVSTFSEGLAAFCIGCQKVPEGGHLPVRGGKWGYINVRGEMAVKPQYEEASPFEDGRARVRLDGQWIRIDKFGKTAEGF